MKDSSKPLFIFEIANNHNGILERGIKLINEIEKITNQFKSDFDFAFKLQYRDLKTFIHPDFRSRNDIAIINKLNNNSLTKGESLDLKNEINGRGFISICTAFDEPSVGLIQEHSYDYIKIASCSFCDWNLLKTIADSKLPIIASTGGVKLDDIDKVVDFFAKKEANLSLLHCIAKYPTPINDLELNQIELLKSRYPQLKIGCSTHEKPDNIDIVKIAVAKGARIFEKHVGLDDYDGSINDYSITPEQVEKWLSYAKEAFDVCGVENRRYKPTQEEINSLRTLGRGAFASRDIKMGDTISAKSIFFAIPTQVNQLLPSDLSENKIAKSDIKANSPIF